VNALYIPRNVHFLLNLNLFHITLQFILDLSSTPRLFVRHKYSHVHLVNTMRINIGLSTTLCMSSYIKCTVFTLCSHEIMRLATYQIVFDVATVISASECEMGRAVSNNTEIIRNC
jgi:hypothetical protein